MFIFLGGVGNLMYRVILILFLVLLFPRLSSAKTLEELLVEKGVITKGEARSADGGASKVYYNGGTRLEFPDSGFTFGINAFIQTRYEFTDEDEDSGKGNSSSFDVKKARIILSGSALHKEFSYYMQADFVGKSEDGENSPELKDAYITWNACDWAEISMGQWKTAISRQFRNSDYKLQFADRSVTSDFFNLGRQQGVRGQTHLADNVVLGAGIYNGSSDGEGINRSGVDTNHTGVVDVRADLMGEMDAYEEGDVGNTEDMAINMGAAYAYSDASNDLGETLGGTQDLTQNSISVDANVKSNGLSVHGEFFWTQYDPDGSDEDSEPVGFYAQVGYFVDPKTVELAVRYSYVDCDDGSAFGNGDCSGNDQLNEATASINYYWWKHNLKAQIGYSVLNEDGLDDSGDINTNRWLLQLTSYL